MNKYRYFIYGNSGGIKEVINDLNTNSGLRFENLNEVFNYIADNPNRMSKNDLALKPYCFDDRINKFVFMITTKRFAKDNFTYPQFAGYFLIEL